MMGDRKGFPVIFLFVIATLLGCCGSFPSFFVLPRVTRTSDAIIIDFDGAGYVGPYDNKYVYGEIANPGFNSHPWPYFHGQSSLTAPAYVPPNRQTVPPACGRGPAALPARSLTSERIASGVDAKKNAWPFMVTLHDRYVEKTILCAGTLISETKVLIAAQCVERESLLYQWLMTVYVGVHSLKPTLDAQMTRRISKIVIHAQYNAGTNANDIAIITLDTPVILSRTVAPACLPPASTDPDQNADKEAAILGWGDGNVLQQARVTIPPNSDCMSIDSVRLFITNSTFCTDSDKYFTCPKDVGGPVVVLTGPATWTVVGINSYTKDCASNGVKTRVSAFRTWIDTYMK